MRCAASYAKLTAMFDRPPAAATATPPVPAHLVFGGALLVLRAVVERSRRDMLRPVVERGSLLCSRRSDMNEADT